MSVVVRDTRSILKVSVQSDGRRLDMGIPPQLPLIELMPGFARSLGILDPGMTHVGYSLQRSNGELLDPSKGAAEQGVEDGDLLTLARGQFLAEPRVYDDIVEAVLDATKDQHRAWTSADNTRTALAVSLTLVAICLLLLLSAGPGLIGSLMALGGAAVLLAVSVVLTRISVTEPGLGLGYAAAAAAACGGFLAVPGPSDLWGWPLAAAALGALLTSGISLAVAPNRPALQAIPAVTGFAVGIPATVTALMPSWGQGAYAVTLAALATLGAAVPWLAMTSARLRVISPQSDSEIFGDVPEVNAKEIQERARAGHRAVVALRFALGLALLAMTPLVAGSSPLGAVLAALAFLSFMFPSRQSYARSAVMVLMGLGTLGLGLSGVMLSITQEQLRGTLLGVIAAVTAVVMTITLISPRARLRLSTMSDAIELTVTAALLPLGVIVAGLA